LAYFEAACRFCRFAQDSGAFVLLRNDLGLQILSLHPVLRGTLFTSKRSWIADFVVVHRIPGHFASFETTLDCRFSRCIRCSGAFGSLRNDLGLQILSLCTGFRGILLTSKRHWIADFGAVHEIPRHLVYFETTLDCRFCRCTRDSGGFGLIQDCKFDRCRRDSGAFGLLRNGIRLQILSLYTGLRGILLTSKRLWIADFRSIYATPVHLAHIERSAADPRRALMSPGESRRARRAQESPGKPRKAQESPGEPRRAQESPGEPRRTQESPGETRTAHESTGEPRRTQESPGEVRTAYESPGEPRRAPESPGDPSRAQESPGEPRRTQESPGERRRVQESPGKPKRVQERPQEPRKAQESPREPRRAQESPREPRRAQESPREPRK
jgi:hypothetical protein